MEWEAALDIGATVLGVVISLATIVAAVILVRKWALFLALEKEVSTYKGLYEAIKEEQIGLKARLESVERELRDREVQLTAMQASADTRLESMLAMQKLVAELGVCAKAMECTRFQRLTMEVKAE